MFELTWTTWIISIVLLTSLFYRHLTKNNDYFTKRGINEPKPYLRIATMIDQLIHTSAELDEKWQAQFGKLYGYFVFRQPVLRVAEPEHIRQLLVKDFDKLHDRFIYGNGEHQVIDQTLIFGKGELWRRIKLLSSPAFTSSKIKLMSNKIVACADDLVEYLAKQTIEHGEVDAKVAALAFSGQVIASYAFGTKLNLMTDQDHKFIKYSKKFLSVNQLKSLAIFILPKWINNLFGYKTVFSEQSIDYFCQLARNIIEDRKSNKLDSNKHNDLLQNLMESKLNTVGDEQGISEDDDLDTNRTAGSVTPGDQKLTEEQVIAQGFAFLFAGYETISSSLSWTLYELALNPEIQDRLYTEVSTVKDIDCESTARLDYLDAVLAETLRLHSPGTALFRQCNDECKLGNTGLTLTKGLNVEFPIHAIHLSEEFYREPKRFDPNRFMPDNRHLIKPYTYLPFGAGPRICIGMRLAQIELKIALAKIITNVKLFRTSKTQCPPTIIKVPQLTSPQSVIIGLSCRPFIEL